MSKNVSPKMLPKRQASPVTRATTRALAKVTREALEGPGKPVGMGRSGAVKQVKESGPKEGALKENASKETGTRENASKEDRSNESSGSNDGGSKETRRRRDQGKTVGAAARQHAIKPDGGSHVARREAKGLKRPPETRTDGNAEKLPAALAPARLAGPPLMIAPESDIDEPYLPQAPKKRSGGKKRTAAGGDLAAKTSPADAKKQVKRSHKKNVTMEATPVRRPVPQSVGTPQLPVNEQTTKSEMLKTGTEGTTKAERTKMNRATVSPSVSVANPVATTPMIVATRRSQRSRKNNETKIRTVGGDEPRNARHTDPVLREKPHSAPDPPVKTVRFQSMPLRKENVEMGDAGKEDAGKEEAKSSAKKVGRFTRDMKIALEADMVKAQPPGRRKRPLIQVSQDAEDDEQVPEKRGGRPGRKAGRGRVVEPTGVAEQTGDIYRPEGEMKRRRGRPRREESLARQEAARLEAPAKQASRGLDTTEEAPLAKLKRRRGRQEPGPARVGGKLSLQEKRLLRGKTPLQGESPLQGRSPLQEKASQRRSPLQERPESHVVANGVEDTDIEGTGARVLDEAMRVAQTGSSAADDTTDAARHEGARHKNGAQTVVSDDVPGPHPAAVPTPQKSQSRCKGTALSPSVGRRITRQISKATEPGGRSVSSVGPDRRPEPAVGGNGAGSKEKSAPSPNATRESTRRKRGLPDLVQTADQGASDQGASDQGGFDQKPSHQKASDRKPSDQKVSDVLQVPGGGVVESASVIGPARVVEPEGQVGEVGGLSHPPLHVGSAPKSLASDTQPPALDPTTRKALPGIEPVGVVFAQERSAARKAVAKNAAAGQSAETGKDAAVKVLDGDKADLGGGGTNVRDRSGDRRLSKRAVQDQVPNENKLTAEGPALRPDSVGVRQRVVSFGAPNVEASQTEEGSRTQEARASLLVPFPDVDDAMDMDETGVARAVFLPGVGETRDGGESGVQLEDLVPVDLAPVHFPPENQAPEDQVPGKHPDAGLRSKAVLDVCEKTTLADTSTGDGGSPALKPDLGHLGLVDAPIYVVPEPRRRGAFPSEAAPDRVEADTGRKRCKYTHTETGGGDVSLAVAVVCSEMHQAADVLVERMQSLEEQISLFEDTAGPLQQTQHVLTPAFYDP